MTADPNSLNPRYEPHESPPLPLTMGLGFQAALLDIAPIVLFPFIVLQAVGGSTSHALWMVSAGLVVNGVTTVLQTVRLGPIGAGCIITSIPTSIAIPFSILALAEGGPMTLAALVAVSALFQILVTMRLSLLRRIITPAVSGTIMMLVAVTVFSVAFGKMNDVAAGSPPVAGPLCALATLVVTVGILLRGPAVWRLWAPVIGIGAGCATAAVFGIYELETLGDAPWFGFPTSGWPGLGLNFGNAFWMLLPGFLFLSVIGVVRTNALVLSGQRASWRDARAIDFRRVQGGSISSALGNVLAGLAGAMPVSCPPTGPMLVRQTGCASRQVGITIGVILVALAFFPKAWSLLSVIPGPVFASYLIIMLAPLFVEGMRTAIQDEADYRRSLLVGVAAAIGLGFEFNFLTLPISGLWGPMLQRGLTSGGIVVVLLTMFMDLTGQGRRRLRTELNVEALPRINEFLKDFSTSRRWSAAMTDRLQTVAEETLLILSPQDESENKEGDTRDRKRLLVLAASDGPAAELEFVSAPSDVANLEDRIALLKEPDRELPDFAVIERDISLRLLQHYATSVSHRQYHETEVITVRVAPAASE